MNTEEIEIASPIETALAKENVTNQVIEKLKADYLTLTVNGIEDKVGFNKVEAARKECKALRNLATRICKTGREDAIRIQKEWIEKEKEVVGKIFEVESHLEAESDRIKEEEKQILFEAAQKQKLPLRKEKLMTLGIEVEDGELLKINDDQFNSLFNEFHEKHLAEKAELLRIEQEKIAAEKAETERIELERKAEEKRLKDLEEAKEKARLEAEKRAQEAIAKAKQEKEDAEARAKEVEEREKVRIKMETLNADRLIIITPYIDADNKVDLSKLWELSEFDFTTIVGNKKNAIERKKKEAEEKAENDRLKALAKAKADQDAALAKAKAEHQAQVDEAERKQREKEQAELKAKQEADRLAEEKRLADIEAELSKGDEQKIIDLVADLEAIKTKYTFKSKKNQSVYADTNTLIDKVVLHIKKSI